MNGNINGTTVIGATYNQETDEYVRPIYFSLVRSALMGQTTTYQALAIEYGLPTVGNQMANTIAPILGQIFEWCKAKGLPYLTSIVVRKSGTEKGVPGQGFWVLHAAGVSAPIQGLQRRRQVTAQLQQEVFDYYKGL